MTQLQPQFRVLSFMHCFKSKGKVVSALGDTLFALPWLALPAPAGAADVQPRQLLAAGRADDAIQLLNSRIKSSPDDAEAQHVLSRVYYSLENWDKAISAAERAVNAAP